MSLADLGKLLLTALLLISLAAGEAAAQTKPAKKRKKPAAAAKEPAKPDENAKTPSSDKKPADAKKPAKPAEEKKAEPAKPATYKLKKGPFHVDVALDGVFEAQNQAELIVRPQEWPQLQVLKAVEHGAAVKQGDLVLALDTEKIDRTITELRAEMQLNELAVKQSEAQLAALEKITPLDADANERPSGSPRKTGSSFRKWKSRWRPR